MLKQTGYSREAPLLPAILRFSIPLMLTGILQLAYNTADSIIVGRYAGHASLAVSYTHLDVYKRQAHRKDG